MTNNIFIDTDCLSAFLWVRNESLLTKLYPGNIVIPKPVYDEIDRPALAWMKQRVDAVVASGMARIVEIKSGTEEFDLYYKLTQSPEAGYKIIGDGEASSIALAKTNNGIVASNNFKDIMQYIEEYKLEYTTTGLIMIDAYKRGFISEEQGNDLWAKMLSKRRKLGAQSFSEYLRDNSY